jgi:hypothetical protein
VLSHFFCLPVEFPAKLPVADPQRSSTNDADLVGGDDKDVEKSKSSLMIQSVRSYLSKDADQKSEL